MVCELQFTGSDYSRRRTMKAALVLGLITFLSATASADSREKAKSNCRVQFTREASASSILIDFEADSREDCERAAGPETQTNFSGKTEAEPILPAKKTGK
jgi:hypothetical protein